MTQCSSCGKEIADNFCSNCGKSAIVEEKKEDPGRVSNKFLEKYDESEILDHISEIIKARIGEKDRLESIHSLIGEGKELDDVNVRYLKDCSDKFNSKQKRKKIKQSDDIKSKEGTPVKKTGSAKDAAIGFGVIIVIIAIIVGVAMVAFPGETKPVQSESGNKPLEKSNQPTKADYEILYSKKQIEIGREYQSDIWSLLSLFHEDSTKEQILTDNISRLKTVTSGNSEELEYLKEDLNSATSGYERTSIKSQIKYLQSIIDYDKQKIIDLENNGISALEEYGQNEIQVDINNHVERIQRLENLNSKNLDYLDTNEKITNYISNYRGTDNNGKTLQTEVESFIKEKYGYDALTKNNPLLEDNWIKTNTIFYFGTDAIDDFSITSERYKVVRYAFFYPLQGEYKTMLGFGLDTETYKVVGDNEISVGILNKLNNN